MSNEEKILAILEKHSVMLEKQGETLEKHSAILEKHSAILEKHSAILETLVNKVELLEIGQAGLIQSQSGLEHRVISLEQQQNRFREEVVENVSYLGEIVGKQLDETQKETKQNSIDIKLIKQKINMADAI